MNINKMFSSFYSDLFTEQEEDEDGKLTDDGDEGGDEPGDKEKME